MKILAFGRLNELVGSSQIEIDTVNSVQELRHELNRLFPQLEREVFAIAVNKVVVTDELNLDNNSEVALLPPFSGG
ncbi:MAG: MoaD/ThiS family protein [Sphingobacteriales bacterium]|jgi:molybdopterin synthase sulfur carrier subunit|nr:MoaD/ThiS family protein [Sphingobacteriales bacterium]